MTYGGFPRVVLEKEISFKYEILKDYLDMIIIKDVVERYAVYNTHIIKIMINFVLSNYAAEFSINSFINKFRSEYTVNKDTIFNYFSYLEDIGFIYYLPRFSLKVHLQYLVNKLYVVVNGLLTLLSFKSSPNTGRIHDNMVVLKIIQYKIKVFNFRDDQNEE